MSESVAGAVEYDPGLLGGGAVVPFIAGWTGETYDYEVVYRRGGVGIG